MQFLNRSLEQKGLKIGNVLVGHEVAFNTSHEVSSLFLDLNVPLAFLQPTR